MFASRTEGEFTAVVREMADCAEAMRELAEKETPEPKVMVHAPVTVTPSPVTVMPATRPKSWTFRGVINGKPFEFTGLPNY